MPRREADDPLTLNQLYIKGLMHVRITSPTCYPAFARYLTGERNKDAAKALGLSYQTYYSQISKAKKLFIDYVKLYDADELLQFEGRYVTKKDFRKMQEMFPANGQRR